MLRAFSSAVSGMRTQMSYMDVVANNIANVNTEAYKASRAHFSDMLYQTLASNSAGTSGSSSSATGGTNPTQIGLGVQLAGTDNIMAEGAFRATGNPLDLAIDGAGFFSVKDSAGTTSYTRDGDFTLDANNNLVEASTGAIVQDDAGADVKVDMTLYSAVNIASDGTIVGTKIDGSGTTKLQKVGLTTFPNTPGLERIGDNLWRVSPASGAAVKVDMTKAGHPVIRSGVLEGSNVDLANEFSNMVIAQRGFQASARVITTSDEMLQDLVNIKH